MRVGEVCNREVIVAHADESVHAAAELMRRYHVGNVVVVEERDGRTVPTGIVTDRDLVVEVMVPELEPKDLAVRDIVTGPLSVAREEDGLMDALEIMRAKAIRRLPVVDADGKLVGILTLDDAGGLLAEMQARLWAVVERQRSAEERRRP
jgi:CBS domain-containing protein